MVDVSPDIGIIISKELPVIEVELPDRNTIEVIANSVVDEYGFHQK